VEMEPALFVDRWVKGGWGGGGGGRIMDAEEKTVLAGRGRGGGDGKLCQNSENTTK
jgi:hypothetical protein